MFASFYFCRNRVTMVRIECLHSLKTLPILYTAIRFVVQLWLILTEFWFSLRIRINTASNLSIRIGLQACFIQMCYRKLSVSKLRLDNMETTSEPFVSSYWRLSAVVLIHCASVRTRIRSGWMSMGLRMKPPGCRRWLSTNQFKCKLNWTATTAYHSRSVVAVSHRDLCLHKRFALM